MPTMFSAMFPTIGTITSPRNAALMPRSEITPSSVPTKTSAITATAPVDTRRRAAAGAGAEVVDEAQEVQAEEDGGRDVGDRLRIGTGASRRRERGRNPEPDHREGKHRGV